jgi:hypothetical protein
MLCQGACNSDGKKGFFRGEIKIMMRHENFNSLNRKLGFSSVARELERDFVEEFLQGFRFVERLRGF